jgi:hypothetical protein
MVNVLNIRLQPDSMYVVANLLPTEDDLLTITPNKLSIDSSIMFLGIAATTAAWINLRQE